MNRSREDFQGIEAKQKTREQNLAAALRSRLLAPRHLGKLTCDWAELAGTGAPSASLVLRRMDTSQAKFIAIDRNPAVLQSCPAHPAVVPLEGEVHHLVMCSDQLNEVGVLNYDSFDSPGTPLTKRLQTLHQFSLKQAAQIGHFLLIVNCALQRTKTRASAAQWFRRQISSTFGGCHTPADIEACFYVSKARPMLNVHIGYGFDPRAAE